MNLSLIYCSSLTFISISLSYIEDTVDLMYSFNDELYNCTYLIFYTGCLLTGVEQLLYCCLLQKLQTMTSLTIGYIYR